MKSGKLVLGVLAGLAAGAALGILFAPDKGKNSRKKITRKSEDILDDMKDKMNHLLDSASTKLGMAKDAAIDSVERGKVKLDKATNSIKEKIAETLS